MLSQELPGTIQSQPLLPLLGTHPQGLLEMDLQVPLRHAHPLAEPLTGEASAKIGAKETVGPGNHLCPVTGPLAHFP